MTEEFRRLLDEAPDAELRAVLRSAERDQPSPRALAQAARTLGIGAAGLGLARAAAAAAGSRALRAAALVKWGGAGILLGGIALSPLILNTPAPSPARVAQHISPQSGNPAATTREASPTSPAAVLATPLLAPLGSVLPSASANSVAPVSSVAPTAVAPLGAVRIGTTAALGRARAASDLVPSAAAPLPPRTTQSFPAPSSTPNAPASAAHGDLLDSEITLLDSARAALVRGDSEAALVLLDRQAQLSVRSLSAEATLVRVQALLLAGHSSEARAVARAALSGRPDLPYAARLRKLAGLPE